MAVTPIEARCQQCGSDFRLYELIDRGNGTCPRCGRELTRRSTATLLADAARADIAQRQLVDALHNLRNLAGNLRLRPHTVLRNLIEEVGWEQDLAEWPDTSREELRGLHRLVSAWDRLDAEQLAGAGAATRSTRRVLDDDAGLLASHLPRPPAPHVSSPRSADFGFPSDPADRTNRHR